MMAHGNGRRHIGQLMVSFELNGYCTLVLVPWTVILALV